jgi:outer membrane receptor for ferrienterochelin and colicins
MRNRYGGYAHADIPASFFPISWRLRNTASAIVVMHDDLVKFGDTDLAEAIKRLPGVTVSGGGIAMRGLGNGYTQILLNGEKAPAGFTFESLSPDMIERIEIRRAATADVSTQAIAGTINIVLRKAPKTAAREFKASVVQGSGNSTPSANGQISDTEGERAWTLGGSGLHRHADITEPAGVCWGWGRFCGGPVRGNSATR